MAIHVAVIQGDLEAVQVGSCLWQFLLLPLPAAASHCSAAGRSALLCGADSAGGTGCGCRCSGGDLRLALHFAAVQGHKAIVQELLDNGADPLSPDAEGRWTPLHAAARANKPTTLEVCLGYVDPSKYDTQSTTGDTALHR